MDRSGGAILAHHGRIDYGEQPAKVIGHHALGRVGATWCWCGGTRFHCHYQNEHCCDNFHVDLSGDG